MTEWVQVQFGLSSLFFGLAYVTGRGVRDGMDVSLALIWAVLGVLWLVGGLLAIGGAS